MRSSQYLRLHRLELNPIPSNISDGDLEETICKTLSLTGFKTTSDNLQTAHRLKNKQSVIVLFKDRKLRDNILYNRRNLQSKGSDLENLGLNKEKYIQESICIEYQQLF